MAEKRPDGVFVVIRTAAEEILLCFQKDRKIWSLPGGGLEDGEGIYAGAVREVREETGLSIEVTRWLGILTLQRTVTSAPETVYLLEAKILGGQLQPDGSEIKKCRYFSLPELERVGVGRYRIGPNQYVLTCLGFYYDTLPKILIEATLTPALVDWIKVVRSHQGSHRDETNQ